MGNFGLKGRIYFSIEVTFFLEKSRNLCDLSSHDSSTSFCFDFSLSAFISIPENGIRVKEKIEINLYESEYG